MSLNGLTVAAFESGMATEITRLIERYGGRPLVTPALREVPLEDNPAAQEFGVRLMAGHVDLLVLLTGVGTTALFDALAVAIDAAGLRAGVAVDDRSGCGRVDLQHIETAEATLDQAAEASRRVERERVFVAGRARQVLEAREGEGANGAAAGS